MKFITYPTLLILVFLFLHNKITAQNKFCTIEFAVQDSTNLNLKNIKINLVQNDKLTRCKINEKVEVYKDVTMSIEFISPDFIIPGIKNLKLQGDTLIFVTIKRLESVLVMSKKSIVRQTLNGFEYSPANDSLFKNRSLLIALQRFPFMNLMSEDAIGYEGGKIMFKINGKEKKGIGDSWNHVLKVLNAKDIYKVEMIREIPEFVKNQGYAVIINILTLDANLYGKTFSIAEIFNSRKNSNANLDFTMQHKKADFSVTAAISNDKQMQLRHTKVLENGIINTENEMKNDYTHFSYNAGFGYGLRIDSANDFSINLALHKYENNNRFLILYGYPNSINNQKNKFINLGADLNVSYIHRKNKFITKSIIAAAKFGDEEFSNKLAYLKEVKPDSIHYKTNTKPTDWIVEYNYLNTKHETYNIEYGVQAYKKDLGQSFYTYTIDSLTNKNGSLINQSKDSVLFNQFAIRPYFKLDKDFTSKQNITLTLSAEYYSIKSRVSDQKNFVLPAIDLSYKKLMKNNGSIKYMLEFSYSKPSIDFLTGQNYFMSPAEERRGSTTLLPGKSISAGINLTYTNKATISQMLLAGYSFDDPSFFSTYDTSAKILVTSPINEGRSLYLNYYIYFQKQINKKFRVSISASPNYVISHTGKNNASYSGFSIRSLSNSTYSLGTKAGLLGFTSFLNSKVITIQGFYSSTVRYSIYYARTFFRRKIAVTLSADQFFKKNRNFKSYSIYKNTERFSDDFRPFRLFKIRVAYNFSNLMLRKYAQKKSTYVHDEKSAN